MRLAALGVRCAKMRPDALNACAVTELKDSAAKRASFLAVRHVMQVYPRAMAAIGTCTSLQNGVCWRGREYSWSPCLWLCLSCIYGCADPSTPDRPKPAIEPSWATLTRSILHIHRGFGKATTPSTASSTHCLSSTYCSVLTAGSAAAAVMMSVSSPSKVSTLIAGLPLPRRTTRRAPMMLAYACVAIVGTP